MVSLSKATFKETAWAIMLDLIGLKGLDREKKSLQVQDKKTPPQRWVLFAELVRERNICGEAKAELGISQSLPERRLGRTFMKGQERTKTMIDEHDLSLLGVERVRADEDVSRMGIAVDLSERNERLVHCISTGT
jgi:hypothetical protein